LGLAIAFTGNEECESRSLSEFAFDKDFSAVGFDDLFHDSETKTHTPFAGGIGFKFVEDSPSRSGSMPAPVSLTQQRTV
jgi:hypothetical protein